MKKEKTLEILLADDDAVDRELFSEALKSTQVKYNLREVTGGLEVIEYLNSAPVKPDMVILDLNMPLKDGRETLKEIKGNKNFKGIPVIILSTSSSRFDINFSYENGASLFMAKPHSFHELIEMVNLLFTIASKYVYFND